jgi:molybdopterin-containing oxidoreductase family iron-sulfur binding subunit
VEIAAKRAEVMNLFNTLKSEPVDLLLLNNVNPVFTLPPDSGVKEALENSAPFVVSFSNFMDETTKLADLIFPVNLPLETWDEYSGWQSIISTQQPAMGKLTEAPHLGDVILNAAFENNKPAQDFKTYVVAQLGSHGKITNELDWVQTLQRGGIFKPAAENIQRPKKIQPQKVPVALIKTLAPPPKELMFQAVPSIRFFDGRGANKSWLCEVPDPLTKVAWQTPVIVHPQILQKMGLAQGDIIKIKSKWGSLEAPIYESGNIHPEMLVMSIGQGHEDYGRYASGMGINPLRLLSAQADEISGGSMFGVQPISIEKTGRSSKLAHTDGSRFTEGRKIAETVDLKNLQAEKAHAPPEAEQGLGMYEFPFALPTEEGYDPKRDFYPPHKHVDYRWAMVVDLDRCIGCAACAVACQAENNVAVVGLKRVLEQREMAWLWIERFHDPKQMEKIIFLPLLCQHCDNAPCEVVCPVYAAHHSKEGLNNQIYNRCVGTRFCSQNCPYKARRFNWFDWQRPQPSHLQLNPDVTVRSKGVMEKCSFCVQRIKEARDNAKNEDRKIRDGEIQPACAQTCPTGVFTFGNIMDKNSRVRQMVEDRRRYQVMGYLNIKPAVIYLKKVLQEV